MIDWSECADAERIPGKVSGTWLVVGSRVPVDAVLDNAQDFSAEEIASEIYPSLPLERVRRIISFAAKRAHAFGPA